MAAAAGPPKRKKENMAKTIKKAIYHNAEGFKPVEDYVLEENADGTVELGNEDGDLLIGKCPVVSEPKEGCCSIVGAKAKKAKTEEPAGNEGAPQDPAPAQ